MIGEGLESLTEGFLSYNGPWDDTFDDVPPNTIFDREDDTLLTAWFVCLVLTGKLEEGSFDCDGETVVIENPGYLLLLEEEYREDIANPSADPSEIFRMFLKLIEMAVNDTGYWPIDIYRFSCCLTSRLA